MSKRNFILLIKVLILAVTIVLGFLYFTKPSSQTGEDTSGTNFIAQFNPFGTNKPATPPVVTPPADISGYQPEPTSKIIVKLQKVSSMPIAGFTVFNKERLKEIPVVIPTPTNTDTPPSASSTTIKKITKPTPPPTEFMPALRYVDRATGNIYQTFADKIAERKFSGTIIPKVYEALFGNKGQSVIMRYLKTDGRTIITFVGNLPKELLGGDTTESNEIKGSFLPENIKDMSLSSDTGSVFYLFNTGDSMVGTTLNLTTNKKVQIFDSPFTEWLSSWPNSKIITLTTKPSFSVPGYMYTIDPNTKNLIKTIDEVPGLTTLPSPNGKLVLYSNNTLSLNLFHTDTKTNDLFGVKTLPEKCIWGKANDVVYCSVPKYISGGQYPDTWYQGETSFSDQIWKIDIKTRNATIIADLATITGGEEIDGIKLMLDEGENYLFFVNKKDSFLWKLQLK
ncbi:MAG: hypothetical protein WC870_00805 [Candidatus Paceibacterota bacterium]